MAYVMGWDPLERFLVGLAIATMSYCTILYINKARVRENKNEKFILYGFAGLFLFFSLGRFLYFLAHLFRDGIFTNGIFYFNTDVSNNISEIIDRLGSISILSSGFLLILRIEVLVKRTYYVISLFQIIFIIVAMIIPYTLLLTLGNVFIVINAIIFVNLLVIFTKWAEYEFRAISAMILFGYCLMLIGAALSAPEITMFEIIPLSVSPLFFIGGALTWISPMLIEVTHFSKAKTYWLIIGIFILGSGIFVILLSIFVGVSLYFNALLSTFEIVLILSLYKAFKLMNQGDPILNEDKPNILSVLSRRPNLTEEEVSISKEKQICLVCKTKLSKQIYLCSECGAFYCIKCSETLSNSENACWACATPFDDLKPSKPFMDEQEELEIESFDIKNEKNKRKLKYRKDIINH